MDYKETLLIPNTNFEMRGNLKEKDPKFISDWKKNNIYFELSNRKAPEFILHDGPPYANGDIHIGHALNKILKDFIIRNAALQGKKINWRTGWDTHGLPIEIKVQQSGIKLSEVGKEAYLKACFDYAESQVEKQQEQFEKLALLTNFDEKYMTLQKDFESRQINVFNKMLNKGLVYQDLKPVHWSWSSETALAEAEIEYKDVTDLSVYVKFKHETDDLNLIIWTTTPWTLPANTAIAYGDNIKYSKVNINGENIVIANDLIPNLSKELELEIKIINDFDMSKLENQYVINPINKNKSLIVKGHHVTTENGTGLVHIAGGHGHDDYIIAKKNSLDLIVVQDEKGHMINSGKYDGMFYLKANKIIAAELEENNKSILTKKIKHSVPIDWRTKEPVIFRATKQWFVSIEPIKNGLISEIKKVKWYPSWGEERLIGMTKNRNDWCISRQRLWGVPIPIIYDENKKPIINKKLQENIVNAFKEDGILAWHNNSIEYFLPKEIEYNEKMTKEMDILDVWFDSGTSFEILGDKISDVILEGNDQYRGWFNSSLINSYISKNRAPYKSVVTHGFVTDAKGNKMSKSIGNTISPMSITSVYGADILRMWVASSNYQDNPKISDESIKQVSRDYRTIRNSIKFLVANTSDFNNVEPELDLMDKSILNEIKNSFELISKRMSDYNFNNALKEIINQLNNGVVKYYLDYSKDYLYTLDENNLKRRSTQYVLNKILDYLLYVSAPFIPVTIEEANKEIKNEIFFNKNVKYPKFSKYNANDFGNFIKIRNEVNKSIEILRNESDVKQSSQASIQLSLPNELKIWKNNLESYLMVGKLEIQSGDLSAKAIKFNGVKCLRCWKYFDISEMDGEICHRCKEVLNK